MTRLLAVLPLLVFGALASIYGAWLLAGDDPDGGRTPVGAFSLTVGLLLLIISALLLRGKRRDVGTRLNR